MITRRGFIGGLAGASIVIGAGMQPAAAAERTFRRRCAVAVIGGGVGGVAAALAALARGRSVILTEESSMLGGQFTSQLVPPDEHYWVEPSMGAYGQTATYAELRQRVRDSYKRWRPVTEQFKADSEANPGNAWVSRIAAEPMVWRNRIDDLLAPYLASGRLKVLTECRPIGAGMIGDRINKVGVRHVNGDRTLIEARIFIDATETGDVLPVVGADHTIGREGNLASGRRELHNRFPDPDPNDQQAITWVAAVGYDPNGDHRTAAPPSYATHRPAFDAFFADRLFDPTREWAWTNDSDGVMRDNPNFWSYRRVIARSNFTVDLEEVSLINFACNDYKGGVIVGVPDSERDKHLAAAKNQTACLIHYLQNDIPRQDGTGHGYPGLRLRPDIAGTPDGYAERPYIREARRMVSLGRVWEWHVGVDARADHTTAAQFGDTVGTGHYWLDIHTGPAEREGMWEECYPYQIPLMALIPRDRSNLLAGGKCLGVSHVVNGAFRLHPTEWSVGEAAGIVAHCALYWGETPKQIRRSSRRLARVQHVLTNQGGQLQWPTEVRSRWKAADVNNLRYLAAE